MTASVRSVGTIYKTSDTPTDSHTLSVPADIEVGDLMLALIAVDNTGGSTDLEIVPPPSGWSYMSNNRDGTFTFDDLMADGSNLDAQMFCKFYANGDGASFDFDDQLGQNHHAVGAIIAIKDPGAIDAYSSYGLGNASYEFVSSASPTCPDVTTGEKSLIIRVCATSRVSNNATLDSVPAGTTELFRETSGASAQGDDVQIGASWSVQTSAGATGTAAFSLSASEEWHAHTICIDLETLYSAVVTTPDRRSSIVYPYFRKRPRLG